MADGRELTDEELVQLREILAARIWAQKTWVHIGFFLKWIAYLSAAVVAAKLLLGDFKDILKGWLLK